MKKYFTPDASLIHMLTSDIIAGSVEFEGLYDGNADNSGSGDSISYKEWFK